MPQGEKQVSFRKVHLYFLGERTSFDVLAFGIMEIVYS